jgi:hypothetical protein
MKKPSTEHVLSNAFEILNRTPYVNVQFNPYDNRQTLAAMIEGDWLEILLAQTLSERPNLDRKGQGAFVIGQVSWLVGLVVAASHLLEHRIPLLSLSTVYLSEENRVPVIVLREGRVVKTRDWHETRQLLLSLFEPIVVRIRELTKLSNAPQWRMISDSIALAFQYVGKSLNFEAEARTNVLALLHDDKSPLQNKRTGFFDVTYKDPSDDSSFIHQEFVRTRAGCCRKYTHDSEYCDTCVHLPIDEQRKRAINSLTKRVEQCLWD